MRLRITGAGPLTSVQDRGRPGWRRFGVPPSGPVDRAAFAGALAALGLAADAAAIELSHGGVDLVCEEGPVAIALTGPAVADGIGGWCVATLAAGERCRIRVVDGNWGYLAVSGRIGRPAWLGSRSTHLIAGLGGGRLVAGDVLEIGGSSDDLAAVTIPRPEMDHGPVRVVLGPQERFFSGETLALLAAGTFAASARFDRMGMVLDGPALPPLRVDMPSEPAVRGALQVDGDGRVSMLTADHQTTGGYPRIGVVVEADVDRVAQLPVGTEMRFALVDAAEAIAATRADAARDAAWLAGVAAGRRARPSLLSVNLIGGVVSALRF